MAVENLRDRSIVSSSNGRKLQNPQVERPFNYRGEKFAPQDPQGIEIFNAESLETQQPFTKTARMRKIEELHGGKPIQDILREEYWDKEKPPREIINDLGIGYITFYKWLHVTGVEVRSVSDSLRLVWKKRRASGEMPVTVNNRTQTKYREAKKILEIDSDKDFKKYLEVIYRQYRSLKAMAEEFRDKGINVGHTIVENWMSNLEIQRSTGKIKESNKSVVEKAFSDIDFLSQAKLTVREEYVVRERYLREGTQRTLNDIGRELGCDRRAVHGSEQNALRKLRIAIAQADATTLA